MHNSEILIRTTHLFQKAEPNSLPIIPTVTLNKSRNESIKVNLNVEFHSKKKVFSLIKWLEYTNTYLPFGQFGVTVISMQRALFPQAHVTEIPSSDSDILLNGLASFSNKSMRSNVEGDITAHMVCQFELLIN